MTAPTTILLAEDHAMVREGMRSFLSQEEDFLIVAEAENGRQAVELADVHKPDVVIMDFGMPLLNGMEAMRQILRNHPGTKVLILSAHSDEAYVRQVIEWGASGYLIKQSVAKILTESIRRVLKDEVVFSPELVSKVTLLPRDGMGKGHSRGGGKQAGPSGLTSREMEVLQLVAEGKPNKESAAVLNLSIKTIEKHRQSAMRKLGIHDTAGVTRYAIANGIISSI